eukprot:scaffold2437_cov395-Prasinococcus_capsulatus_cf.AAC.28
MEMSPGLRVRWCQAAARVALLNLPAGPDADGSPPARALPAGARGAGLSFHHTSRRNAGPSRHRRGVSAPAALRGGDASSREVQLSLAVGPSPTCVDPQLVGLRSSRTSSAWDLPIRAGAQIRVKDVRRGSALAATRAEEHRARPIRTRRGLHAMRAAGRARHGKRRLCREMHAIAFQHQITAIQRKLPRAVRKVRPRCVEHSIALSGVVLSRGQPQQSQSSQTRPVVHGIATPLSADRGGCALPYESGLASSGTAKKSYLNAPAYPRLCTSGQGMQEALGGLNIATSGRKGCHAQTLLIVHAYDAACARPYTRHNLFKHSILCPRRARTCLVTNTVCTSGRVLQHLS